MSTKLSGYNKKAIFYAKTTHLCYNIQKIGFFRSLSGVFYACDSSFIPACLCYYANAKSIPSLSHSTGIPSSAGLPIPGWGLCFIIN